MIFSDGTEVAADVVVFCTGFVGDMRGNVEQIFGKSVADEVGEFWGLDEEGEIKGAYKRSGRKSDIHHSRWSIADNAGRSGHVVHRRNDSRIEILLAPCCAADQGSGNGLATSSVHWRTIRSIDRPDEAWRDEYALGLHVF